MKNIVMFIVCVWCLGCLGCGETEEEKYYEALAKANKEFVYKCPKCGETDKEKVIFNLNAGISYPDMKINQGENGEIVSYSQGKIKYDAENVGEIVAAFCDTCKYSYRKGETL